MADIKRELRDLGWHAEPDGNPSPNRGRVYRALARLRDELREPSVSDDVSGGPPSATTAGANLTVYPYDSRYKHLYIYDAGPARVTTRADRPSKPNWSIAPESLTTREELRRAFGVNPTGELVLASRAVRKRSYSSNRPQWRAML